MDLVRIDQIKSTNRSKETCQELLKSTSCCADWCTTRCY